MSTTSIYLDALLRKFDKDVLFRRLAIGSPTFSEMVAEAILKDGTGQDYRLAKHNAPSIDLEAPDGQHVQVKTVGTPGSFAGIKHGRDAAQRVMVITTFGERVRFFLVPMERFKSLARTYPAQSQEISSWEITGSRIASGLLDEFELPSQQLDRRPAAVPAIATASGRAVSLWRSEVQP